VSSNGKNGKKVVALTGGTGFLGSHVAERLHQAGHTVRALVRKTSNTKFLDQLGVEKVLGAIDDRDSLPAFVEGADAIIHCAGLTKARNDMEFRRVNGEAAGWICDAAITNVPGLKRFVQVSSQAAMGPSNPDGTPKAEDEPPTPVSAYGRSKLAGEKEVLERSRDLPVTIVRPPAIYGPRDREIFSFFQMASVARMAPVVGHGDHKISMIYATDCAEAIIAAALDDSERTGAVYHVDDGGVWTWNQMARTLGEAFGKKVYVPHLPKAVMSVAAVLSETFGKITGKAMIFNRDKVTEFTMSCVGGHDRITEDLGWKPAIPLPDGMRRAVQWYQENGWL